MGEGGGVDLIRVSDGDIGGSSVRLRVLGRHSPGATPYNDHLDAEVVVASGFANGRLEMCLSPEDLNDWSAALDELSKPAGASAGCAIPRSRLRLTASSRCPCPSSR